MTDRAWGPIVPSSPETRWLFEQNKPSLADILRALSRMTIAAREHGHYSMDRLDAGWIEAAVDMLIRAHGEGGPTDGSR